VQDIIPEVILPVYRSLQLRSTKLQFNINQGDFYNATMVT
jgi:hypothetical protein